MGHESERRAYLRRDRQVEQTFDQRRTVGQDGESVAAKHDGLDRRLRLAGPERSTIDGMHLDGFTDRRRSGAGWNVERVLRVRQGQVDWVLGAVERTGVAGTAGDSPRAAAVKVEQTDAPADRAGLVAAGGALGGGSPRRGLDIRQLMPDGRDLIDAGTSGCRGQRLAVAGGDVRGLDRVPVDYEEELCAHDRH